MYTCRIFVGKKRNEGIGMILLGKHARTHTHTHIYIYIYIYICKIIYVYGSGKNK